MEAKNAHIRKPKCTYMEDNFYICAFWLLYMNIYGSQNAHIRKRAFVYTHFGFRICAFMETKMCIWKIMDSVRLPVKWHPTYWNLNLSHWLKFQIWISNLVDGHAPDNFKFGWIYLLVFQSSIWMKGRGTRDSTSNNTTRKGAWKRARNVAAARPARLCIMAAPHHQRSTLSTREETELLIRDPNPPW